MNQLEQHNIHMITLDVHISCDTFWDYKFNIPIRIADFYNPNLVDYVIQHIYDDMLRKRQQRDIPILLKKARKFHIHGRTLEDLLFPPNRTNEHMMPENIVYICTHC